jgi:hypothetical protein
MYLALARVVMTVLMAGLAFATVFPLLQDATLSAQPPLLDTKVKYRQLTKGEILRRTESRSIAARAGALQPRQSAQPAKRYPICSALPNHSAVPSSNFANFQGYAILDNADNPRNPNANTIVSADSKGPR